MVQGACPRTLYGLRLGRASRLDKTLFVGMLRAQIHPEVGMHTTIRSTLPVILAVTLTGCARVDSLPVATRPVDGPATIPLSTYIGPLRSMAVTVANAAHHFIFDTGGGETMITPELASAIGCIPYGRTIGFRAGGEQVAFEYCDDVLLRLGDVAITHERVGVFDLKSILPAGAPPADGVVSLRSFRGQRVTIDLTKGRITVETADSLVARTRGVRPLTIRVATGPTGAETNVYIAARVGGRRVWFLLDSGNGDPLLVAPHVARMAGLVGSTGEALIEFDGLGPIRLPTSAQNMIYDGMLGAAFLQEWVITLDLGSSRAWAVPAARPNP